MPTVNIAADIMTKTLADISEMMRHIDSAMLSTRAEGGQIGVELIRDKAAFAACWTGRVQYWAGEDEGEVSR